MKLTDILDAARKESPNLELEVEDVNGQPVDVTLRNILAMPKEDRRKLADDSDDLEEGTKEVSEGEASEDQISLLATKSYGLLKTVAQTAEQFEALEFAMGLDPDIEDLGWISLFAEYSTATQLGEADSSQSS